MNQSNTPAELDGNKFSVNNALHGKIYQKNESFLQQKSSPPSNNAEKFSRVQYLTQIEVYLLAGQREAAYELAMQQEDWSLAMMFACVLGPEKYQEVMKVYAQKNFAPTSPLHLVSMLYSNQAQKTIALHGSSAGKFLHNPQQFQNPNAIGAPSTSTAESSNVLSEWKMVVSILLSNKTHDWEQLMNTLALRLQSESKDIFAAHFVYLCGNNNLSFPKKKAPKNAEKPMNNTESREDEAAKDFTLLGCESSFGGSRIMADVISISALRMSEIFERSLSLTPISTSPEEKEKQSASAKGGLFGWFQSNNKTQSTASAAASETTKVVDEKMVKLAAVLCPYKVRFAMTLADMGLVKEASSYIRSALQLVQEVGIAGAEDSSGTKKKTVPPFNKKFVVALEEFADRLGVRPLHSFDGSVSVGTNYGAPPIGVAPSNNATPNAQNKPTGSSFWDISKVISSSTLKEFVDGPQASTQPPPSAAAAPTGPVPVMNVQAQPSTQGPPPVSGFPPMPSNVKNPPAESAPQPTNAPPSTRPPQSTNPHAKHKHPSHAFQQMGGGPPLPFASSSRNNNNNNAAPAVNPNASSFPPVPPSTANNNTSFPPVPYPVAQPTGTDANDPFGDSVVPNSPGWYVGVPPTGNTSAPPSGSGGLPALTDNGSAADDFGLTPPSSAYGNIPPVPPPSAYPYSTPSQYTSQPPQPPYQQPYLPSNPPQSSHPPTPFPQSGPYQQSTQPKQEQPAPTPAPVVPIAAPKSNNDKAPPVAVDKTDKKDKDVKAPAANNNNADAGGGLMGTFRKGIFKWIYPDAHDANENIGKSLEAYYDEKLGRWVFPGEVENNVCCIFGVFFMFEFVYRKMKQPIIQL
jgi:hypothetical protein